MEHNLHCTHAYQEDLLLQMAAAEDQSALVEEMQEEEEEEEEEEIDKGTEEEQAHRAQLSVLSQMQLWAMERVEEQEHELR